MAAPLYGVLLLSRRAIRHTQLPRVLKSRPRRPIYYECVHGQHTRYVPCQRLRLRTERENNIIVALVATELEMPVPEDATAITYRYTDAVTDSYYRDRRLSQALFCRVAAVAQFASSGLDLLDMSNHPDRALTSHCVIASI